MGRTDCFIRALFLATVASAGPTSGWAASDSTGPARSLGPDRPTQSRASSPRPPVRGPDRLQGEIVRLGEMELIGAEVAVLMATLETREGQRVPVCLGPVTGVEELDLDEGDWIEVVGRHGEIENRPVLIAERVRSGDQSISVDMPRSSRGLQAQLGRILDARIGAERASGEEHLLARVRLNSGMVQLVNFGPVEELEDANLRRGDLVEFLAQPAWINDEPALEALQVRVRGRAYDTR